MSEPTAPAPFSEGAAETVRDPSERSVARAVSLAAWGLAAGAVLLVPWTVYLAVTLPRHVLAVHYDLAWTGFDVMLVVILAAAAYAAFRAPRWLPVWASSAATMLVVDAWFDVITSHGMDKAWAVLAALLVELPVALACIWLAGRVQALEELRLSRSTRPARARR
jgi:hypothetical protein